MITWCKFRVPSSPYPRKFRSQKHPTIDRSFNTPSPESPIAPTNRPFSPFYSAKLKGGTTTPSNLILVARGYRQASSRTPAMLKANLPWTLVSQGDCMNDMASVPRDIESDRVSSRFRTPSNEHFCELQVSDECLKNSSSRFVLQSPLMNDSWHGGLRTCVCN
ncbi:uncharacterized protein ARMOST_02334 [Armillaria ostoyae]|uniref:Uncharacterized protein n=1 Tax=Armillaria ostoyae TaxID=47428 RepID=A0A284QRD9_ARMOS|nr:uncharacterized protein ARMOST_02334 [Armillaria ostoyae]